MNPLSQTSRISAVGSGSAIAPAALAGVALAKHLTTSPPPCAEDLTSPGWRRRRRIHSHTAAGRFPHPLLPPSGEWVRAAGSFRAKRAGCWFSLLAALTLFGCGKGSTEKAADSSEPKIAGETVSFPTNAPQLASLTIQTAASRAAAPVPLFGRLVWSDDATVRVFTPFGGRVRKTLVQVGTTVEKGAPLAEVESPDFGQAQSDVRRAEADLQLAQRNLARLRELLAHGAAAQKDVDSAEADQGRAESERARAVARLEVYGGRADSVDEIFVLRSPIAGTVVEKSVTVGQEIRSDQMLANAPELFSPLFILSDPARLWIEMDAHDSDLPRLREGSDFTFRYPAWPKQVFRGRVSHVAESIDPITRTVKVRGTVENPGRLLKAEMFVSVDLPAGEIAALSLPAKAVFLNKDKHYVFVEEQPGQFTRQEVQVGALEEGWVEIQSGVRPGQPVVTDGCLLLEELLE